MFRKTFLALILIALLAPACASGAGTKKSGNTGSSGQKSSLDPAGDQSPFQKEFSAPKIAPPPVAKRDTECIETFANAPKSTPDSSKSFVVAVIDPSRSLGPNCPKLAPGNDCQVPFEGGWRLVETPQGSMVFQVFENDSKTPVRSPELGPVPNGGQFSRSTRLFYKVGANAHKATFRVLLKDALGRVVAQSEPQTVAIPACFGDR